MIWPGCHGFPNEVRSKRFSARTMLERRLQKDN